MFNINTIASSISDFGDHLFVLYQTLNAICEGALLEGCIVAACVIFFLLYYDAKPANGKQKCAHVPGKAGKAADIGKSGKHWKSTASVPVSDRRNSEEHSEVHRLVFSLTQSGKTGKQAMESLENYKAMVWQQRVDLSSHLTDHHHARSLYLALTSCSIQVGSTGASKSPRDCDRSALGWTQQFLADMRTFSFPRTIEFYTSVVKMFSNDCQWNSVLMLEAEMVADGIDPDNAVLVAFLNAAVAADDAGKTFHFFRGLAKLGPPTLRTYMTVLRVHARRKDHCGAVQLIDNMKSYGVTPDNLVLNQVLGLCVSAGQVDVCERMLAQWEGIVDAISYNTVLKGYTQRADLRKAEAMLQHMLTHGPAPNLITFNTIMDCAVRALQAMGTVPRWSERRQNQGDKSSIQEASKHKNLRAIAKRPWELLEQLIELGLEPDRYTCSTIVKGMHLSGVSGAEIDRAVALLRRIGPDALKSEGSGSVSAREGNTRLVEVLFNTLLDICTSSQDLDRMVEIFGMMQGFNVVISAVTFGTLIKAFGQAGKLNRCHEVWKQMKGSTIVPTVVTYGCYIDACIRNQDMAAAKGIFDSMSVDGVKPNAVIYTSLIRGLAANGEPVQAFALYREMRKVGVEPTSVTFNSLLDMVARQLTDPAHLKEVIDDMNASSQGPDVTSYSILIKSSCNSGNLDNAIALYRQIRAQGVACDSAAFNMLLLVCSRSDRVADAEEIFSDMYELQMPVTNVTLSIILKMFGRAKLPNRAFDIFAVVEEGTGEKPNLYAYTCLIQALSQNKQVRRSWEVFERMLRRSIEPDAVTYGTLVNGCVYLNQFEHAMSLVRHAYLKPAKQGFASPSEDPPFPLHLLRLKRPVRLQSEVLHGLAAALQRKGLQAPAQELAGIMRQFGAAPEDK
jgi:pentatricopeptide repeat protein